VRTPRPLKLKPPEPTEAEIQAALIRGLQVRGWLVVRVNGGGFKTATGGFFRAYIVAGFCDANGRPACSGFPDVLALKIAPDGSGIVARLFEVKKRGGARSAAQERFAEFAEARGVRVEVVQGWAAMELAVKAAG